MPQIIPPASPEAVFALWLELLAFVGIMVIVLCAWAIWDRRQG
jgi:hypothetical protein